MKTKLADAPSIIYSLPMVTVRVKGHFYIYFFNNPKEWENSSNRNTKQNFRQHKPLDFAEDAHIHRAPVTKRVHYCYANSFADCSVLLI